MENLVKALAAPAHLKSRQYAEKVAVYLHTKTVIGTDGVLRHANNRVPISGNWLSLALHFGMPVNRNATNAAAREDQSNTQHFPFESTEVLAAYLLQHLDLEKAVLSRVKDWMAARSSAPSFQKFDGRDQKGRYWGVLLSASLDHPPILELKRNEWEAVPPGYLEDE